MKYFTSVLAGAVVATLAMGGCSGEGDGQAPNTPGGTGTGTTMNDVQREMGEAADAAGNLLEQKKNEFLAAINRQSENFDDHLATLRSRAEELEGEARLRINGVISSLEQQTVTWRNQVSSLQNASAEAWEEMQTGVQDAADALELAYRDAIDEFSEESP